MQYDTTKDARLLDVRIWNFYNHYYLAIIFHRAHTAENGMIFLNNNSNNNPTENILCVRQLPTRRSIVKRSHRSCRLPPTLSTRVYSYNRHVPIATHPPTAFLLKCIITYWLPKTKKSRQQNISKNLYSHHSSGLTHTYIYII